MNIALIGYGKMGKILERIAKHRGHNIVCIIDKHNPEYFDSEQFASADVALEFSVPQTACENIKKAWKANVKVVCGTTGWQNRLSCLVEELKTNGQSLFWASNFSLGVNIFFETNRRLAKIMNSYPAYSAEIVELHHTQKKDAPSGTAITTSEIVCSQIDKYSGWTLQPNTEEDKIGITAIREADIFGIHSVKYSSNEDTLQLTHEAKNRNGFAIGAIVAAEFLQNKSGYYTMKELLNFEGI